MSSAEPNTIKLSELQSGTIEGRKALELWKRLRGEQPLPRWEQFDATEIPSVSAQSVFLKYRGPSDWLVKLFGSELAVRFGGDITGMNVLDVMDGPTKVNASERLELFREGKHIIRSENEMHTAMDVRLVVEWLLLPFADKDGEATYAVQVVAPLDDGVPGRALFNDQQVGRTVLAVDIAEL